MSQTTERRALRKRLKFKSYRYQLLQYVTAQNKEILHTSCCVVLFDFKMNYLQPQMFPVMKSHSIYWETLIDII
jgi:hypothetical protein